MTQSSAPAPTPVDPDGWRFETKQVQQRDRKSVV